MSDKIDNKPDENNSGFFSGNITDEYLNNNEEKEQPDFENNQVKVEDDLSSVKKDNSENYASPSKPIKKEISKMMKFAIGGVVFFVLLVAILFFMMTQEDKNTQSAANEDTFKEELQPPAQLLPELAESSVSQSPSNMQAQPENIPASSAETAQPIAATEVVATTVKNIAQATEQDDKLKTLDSRVSRIEEFLSQHTNQNNNPTIANKKPKHPKVKAKKEISPAPSVSPSVSKSKTIDGQEISVLNSNGIVSAEISSLPPELRVICTYQGALNNRAWVSCNNELHSVKRGDMLPSPYGVVTAIDDAIGSVTTSGGIIR